MWNEERIPVGPLRLNRARFDNAGPTVVMMHGVLRNWHDFASLIPSVAVRRNVLALDHRGHGLSDRAVTGYHVRDYAEDATLFVNELPAMHVVLYGHSLGALCALAVAAVLPERVEAVILEDPPSPDLLAEVQSTPWHAVWTGMHALASSTTSVHRLSRELAEVRQPMPDGSTARLGDLRDAASLRFSGRCLKDVDPDVFVPLLENRWLEGFDLDAILARVRCPTLILRGDPALGGMLPRDTAEAMAGKLFESLLVDLPGVGHLMHQQDAAGVLRVVLPFLESLPG